MLTAWETVVLCGLNQLEGVVAEPLPDGVGNLESCFRNRVHLRSELGANIMAQIPGTQGNARRRPDRDTVEAWLEDFDARRQKFVIGQPVQVSRYREKIMGSHESATE